VRYGFENLDGKIKIIGEDWTKQDIIDAVFMLKIVIWINLNAQSVCTYQL
jgi:hypothetical protein